MNYLKHKNIILLFSIIGLINQTIYSQDEDNNWVIGVGINAVDIRTPDDFSGILKDYLNGSMEDVNMGGGFIRVFVGKYISNGMTLQFSASANKIKKGYNYSTGDLLLDDSFLAVDSKLKYDLNLLVGETAWFDPFVLSGIGYSKIGDSSNFNIAVGWGFNTWISDTIGINFQSDYNHNLRSTATDYFQHSIGLVFKLNANKNATWSKNRVKS